ncbi:uncharacterized protein yc1106_04000 [Curvularia clavata]|uniref:SHSP domain-containing protein n=1 Tax=Curvularia clavata TaxID=95742 RepID=A0A9Q8Z6J3_CURCL|nr:uncharacterized protein yc1106_04000 [Curvularia clavata]
MAFVLTPSFAPVYHTPQHNPLGFCAPVARSPYGYRVHRAQPRRPQYSPYGNFFSQVSELLSEIDREAQRQAQLEAHREAQREAHRQRQQQRKRALRAKFDVNQSEQGWQVEGDIQGFDSENISIEVTDEHTLKITGNTQWQREAEPKLPQIEEKAESSSTSAVEQSTELNIEAPHDEPETETATEGESTNPGIATPDSDTMSHKSYQATVEDDFEDLGAESSSLVSSRPSTPVEDTQPKEPKGKEKAVEEPETTETALTAQPQSGAVAHSTQEQAAEPQEPRVHGSFTRSFRFPSRIDVANVSASFKDGVLRVNVPRAQAPQVRRIAIL